MNGTLRIDEWRIMTPLFSKTIGQLRWADVERLLEDEIPEGQQVEYKAGLSTKKGGPDLWMNGEGRIGDKARDAVLECVVGFANAQGGNLVLGVEETDSKPNRPAGFSPLPNCHDLAERFRRAAREIIEPDLSGLESFGVSKDGGDDGVVVIRVAPSRLAPHRLTSNLKSMVRRNDETTAMTMREIQDRTIDLARGEARLEQALDQRRTNYRERFFALPFIGPIAGVRVTLLPVRGGIHLDRIYEQAKLNWLWAADFSATINDKEVKIQQPGRLVGMDPLTAKLRGGEQTKITEQGIAWRELSTDGLVEIGFRHYASVGLSAGAFLATVANGLLIGDTVRTVAGAPATEYALEAEIRCDLGNSAAAATSPLVVASPGRLNPLSDDLGTLDHQLPLRFPLVRVSGAETFNSIMTGVYNDLLNSLGLHSIERVEIDWPVV